MPAASRLPAPRALGACALALAVAAAAAAAASVPPPASAAGAPPAADAAEASPGPPSAELYVPSHVAAGAWSYGMVRHEGPREGAAAASVPPPAYAAGAPVLAKVDAGVGGRRALPSNINPS